MGECHDRRVRIQAQFGKGLVRPASQKWNFSEGRPVRESLARFDEHDFEACKACHRDQGLGNVHRANDHETRIAPIGVEEERGRIDRGAFAAIGRQAFESRALDRVGGVSRECPVIASKESARAGFQLGRQDDGLPVSPCAQEPVEFFGARFDAFHQDGKLPAAAEAYFPGHAVVDPHFKDFRSPVLNDFDAFCDDAGFHAARGDRAGELATAVDDELAAGGARRRTPGLKYRGEGHRLSLVSPLESEFERVVGEVGHA